MKEKEDELKLSWRDYLALFLASLQTVMLPALVLIGVIFVILLYASFLR